MTPPMGVRVRGSTRAAGVIGWPVSASLSPAIHNAAFAALGLDWVYVPLPVPPGSLPAAIEGLRALGFAGANVTMPHKTEAAEVADTRSEDAQRLKAANTLVFGTEGCVAHNTDVGGFDRFLRRDAGFDPDGRTALVFGSGGAARACALALARGGLARLLVAVRDEGRTADLRAALEDSDTEVSTMALDDAPATEVELIVNATPLGAAGERLPLPPLGPGTLIVDLLYRPAMTPLQRDARDAGATGFGGLGLLLHQAALSFQLWTGQSPPLSAMSAAAVAELTEAEDGAGPAADASGGEPATGV